MSSVDAVSISDSTGVSLTALIPTTGPNAIRILQELGVWEDVLAICGAESLNMNTFRYVSGPGDHEILYEVGELLLRPCQWTQTLTPVVELSTA